MVTNNNTQVLLSINWIYIISTEHVPDLFVEQLGRKYVVDVTRIFSSRSKSSFKIHFY